MTYKSIAHFVSGYSHNLRSQLTSIEGLASIAAYHSSSHELSHCLQRIHQCSEDILEIISSLELYVTIQNRELMNGQIQPHFLVEKIVSDYKREMNNNRISICTEVRGKADWVADEEVCHIILKNLVAYAIRFKENRKENKRIEMQIDILPNVVNLKVSYSGIGMVERENQVLFDSFHGNPTQLKGGEIWLFIAMAAADKLNAKVTVKTLEQVCTSFVVSIPNQIQR